MVFFVGLICSLGGSCVEAEIGHVSEILADLFEFSAGFFDRVSNVCIRQFCFDLSAKTRPAQPGFSDETANGAGDARQSFRAEDQQSDQSEEE